MLYTAQAQTSFHGFGPQDQTCRIGLQFIISESFHTVTVVCRPQGAPAWLPTDWLAFGKHGTFILRLLSFLPVSSRAEKSAQAPEVYPIQN